MGQVLHILLVEDNPGDADLIEELLAKSVSLRCVFAQVDRLAAAFEALEHARFDMVMLDLDLPDTSGLETIARLCEMVERVPVIILSATEDQRLALEALKAGVEDYLVKGKVTGEVIERIIGYALERHRNRQRLRESQQFLRATLDALASHVAILDSSGRIVNVNKAWFDFAQANGADYATISPGVSYLDACWAVTGEDAPTAMAVAEGILAVIGGQSDYFEMEYPCHGPQAERWFYLRVTPFPGASKRQVVVVHENITARKQAEAGRAESERLFEKVFELIPVGLWLLDGKGRIIRGNPEGNRIWGGSPLVSREDYEAYKVKRLPSREPVDLHNLSIVKTLRDGVTISDELLEMEAIDGAIRTLLNFSAPLRRADGSIVGAVVAHLDLTKRYQMEQALIASERRIREVFNASPNCLFVKDRRGRFVMVNITTARLYRARCEDMIGRTDAELVGDAWKKGDRTFALPPHAGGPANGSGLMTEASFTGNDGQTRWFRMFKSPMYFEGAGDCELTIAIDVTQQREARERLHNSELLMRTILDTLSSRIVLMDPNLRIIWVNQAAERCGRVEATEMIGLPCYQFFAETGEICADCSALEAISTGGQSRPVKRIVQGRTWLTSANPIRNEAGEIVSVVEVAEDITERLALEGQLRQAQKMESLGTLAGGIAHDFNNILAGILGYTELAKMKTSGNAPLQDYLEEVYGAGLRATELVRQILTFSRRQSQELKPLQVPLVVKEALKLLRSTLPTTVELKSAISTQVDPVMADPTQIHQLVMNLCTNASHAMEPDGGVLTVTIDQITPEPTFFSRHPDLMPGPYLRLEVSDTGCGIPPEIIDSIFDPYFTTKDLGEGTGLGLAVVHGIVKEYGGEILVRSAPSEGATFIVLLPVSSSSTAEDQAHAGQVQWQGGQERILLVDDEPHLSKLYYQFLTQFGYQVTAVNDPLKALELLRADPSAFDLVLSDVTMPRMTGEKMGQLMMEIRPDLPILLMTGFHQHLTDEVARERGFRGLLAKPLVNSVLLHTLRTILNQNQG